MQARRAPPPIPPRPSRTSKRSKERPAKSGSATIRRDPAGTNDSELERLRVDLTAYEVLGIADTLDATDEIVRAARDEQSLRATSRLRRVQIEEAFKTLESEACRRDYRLALSLKSTTCPREGATTANNVAETEPAAFDVPLPLASGIVGILCAPDAPYAQLLEAALKVRGDFELELPQIVVCGTESMGKSSTLERIAMRDIFPRSTRFCTRMPIRLMLRSSRHQNQVTIRVKDLNTNEIVRASEPQICTTGDQTDEPFSSQVAELIRDFISEEHPGDNSERNVIVDREVQVEMHAPSVPTIDLVDLPGIVTSPMQASVATTEITRRFLAQDHVLALAVVSARSESLHGNGIWPLLREAGRPAVVVLTNVDRNGGGEDLRARLERDPAVLPEDVPIVAVVPVANRDTRKRSDIASLRASYALEEAALQRACKEESIEYSRERHGMPAVLLALNDMIREYMRNHWVDAELERCRDALRALFCDLWCLGTKPEKIDSEELRREIMRGLDAFAQLPTAEVMDAVNVFHLHVDKQLPDNAPIAWRVQHANTLVTSLRQNVDDLTAQAWAGFKALVLREVLDKSELPLKLARFPGVAKHVGVTLDCAFARARAGASERALACITDRILKALATSSDSIGAAVWQNLADAVTADLISSFSITLLSKRIVRCDGDLMEESELAEKRANLEGKVDALYRTVQVLQDLAEDDDLGRDIAEARSLRFGGPTADVNALRAKGNTLYALVVDDTSSVRFADLIAYAEKYGTLLECGNNKGAFFNKRTALSLIRHTGEEALMACKRYRSPLLSMKGFILEAVCIDGSVLAYASKSLRGDRKVVLAAVTNSAMALAHAAETLRADRSVALAAVTRFGPALRHASMHLRCDKEIILAAVQGFGPALAVASSELQGDKEVVLAAVANFGSALEFASRAMRGNREVALVAVNSCGAALEFASEELRADREVVLIAVRNFGVALRYASEDLRADREVVLEAVAGFGKATKRAAKALSVHEEVVLRSVSHVFEAYRIASKHDSEIIFYLFLRCQDDQRMQLQSALLADAASQVDVEKTAALISLFKAIDSACNALGARAETMSALTMTRIGQVASTTMLPREGRASEWAKGLSRGAERGVLRFASAKLRSDFELKLVAIKSYVKMIACESTSSS